MIGWRRSVSERTGSESDPEAYELAARRLALPADQVLFVDDRAINCEAARAAGMQAIHFENDVDALRRALVARGALD